MPSCVLTLLSDFGWQDTYVGVMKGAIAQVNPQLTVIDLTHQIPPQNIAAARFALSTAVPYFPVGTVHLAVVDPGVGGQRRATAIAVGTDLTQPFAWLVGPDNGIFGGVIEQYSVLAAVELNNSHFWRVPTPSTTFHGRDIFAPVAAYVGSGVALTELGTAIMPESLVELDLPKLSITRLTQTRSQIQGCIQAIDHFGNLVTNIPAKLIAGKSWQVVINQVEFPGRNTYSDVPLGNLVTLVGSHGWVEIAVNGGNAQQQLNLDWGYSLEVIVVS